MPLVACSLTKSRPKKVPLTEYSILGALAMVDMPVGGDSLAACCSAASMLSLPRYRNLAGMSRQRRHHLHLYERYLLPAEQGSWAVFCAIAKHVLALRHWSHAGRCGL
jgi:hypothetical protein